MTVAGDPEENDPRVVLIKRARELGRNDLGADNEPRVLTGELASAQWAYDESYTEAQIERSKN